MVTTLTYHWLRRPEKRWPGYWFAEHQSAVLDLSELSKSAARRLMTDFLETLYRVNRAGASAPGHR